MDTQTDPVIHTTEIFRLMGKTLVAVQALEYSLSHYLALWAGKSPAEAKNLLESSLKKTLGTLLKVLQKEKLVPDGLEEELEQFRIERNWFVHHLFSDNWEDTLHPQRARALINRLEAVRNASRRFAYEFTDLNEKWCRAKGMTDKDLTLQVSREFEKMMDPQPHEPDYRRSGSVCS